MDVAGIVVATAAVERSQTVMATVPAGVSAVHRFEIGSVTKTMTATVLARLVVEGILTLDDQIGQWLSAGDNAQITLRQLATHTSGLPPVGHSALTALADRTNPWAGYTFERAEQDLRQATVTPGRPWRYSNLGYQLLGLILERASKLDYPTLITDRLLDPLAMAHSGVGARGLGILLPGHDGDQEVPRWDQPWGAGGIESTIADLARYAHACLWPGRTPLGAALTLTQTPVLQITDDAGQALGWRVPADGIREHSGGTGGFSACVSLDQTRARAVVILVSHRGSQAYSAHLKHTARLVLAGQNPQQVRAPRPWPAWRQAALHAVHTLLNGDLAGLHQQLAPPGRAKITLEHLERAWTAKTQQAGLAGEPTVVSHELAPTGTVVLEISLPFATGPQRLRIAVLPSGELGGLTFPPGG